MSGVGKFGALVVAFVVPVWLQGCNPITPEQRAIFDAETSPYFCIPAGMGLYANQSSVQLDFVHCATDDLGKLLYENASTCCMIEEEVKGVHFAEPLCCSATFIGTYLENVTNDTLKEQVIEGTIERCHQYATAQIESLNMTMLASNCPGNISVNFGNISTAASIPTHLEEESLHVMYKSEMDKAMEMAQKRSKAMGRSMETISSRPAGVAAILLLAGASTACLAHGVMAFVSNTRAQRERQSGYNQLLA